MPRTSRELTRRLVPNGTVGQERLFRALHEIAVAVGGLLDPPEIARLVCGRAGALVGAESDLVMAYRPPPRNEIESPDP